MTNSITLVTVLVTNFVTVSLDRKQESGTNYQKMIPVVCERTYIEEITLCTNRTLYRVGPPWTNGPVQWTPVSTPGVPPPLPLNVMQKE
jgi:hypothetical protein